MQCACYNADPANLVAALCETEALTRYLDAIAEEVPTLADRGMIVHLKRMSTMASRVLSEGLDRVCAQDRAAADALLTDLFAVATYRRWPLPITDLGMREVEIGAQPRGLLGADAAVDGAHLWVLDDHSIALARIRESDAVVDMESHPRS